MSSAMENINLFKSNIYIEYNYIDSFDPLLNSKNFIEINEYYYNLTIYNRSSLSDLRFNLGSFKKILLCFKKVLLDNDYSFNEVTKKSLLTYVLSFNEFWRSLKKYLFITSEEKDIISEALYVCRK